MVTVRLDRQDLAALSAAAFRRLPNARSLHLQHNRLSSVPALHTHLPALRFLSLAHNQLTSCAGLEHLSTLMTLDASHNRICELELSHLPTSLRFLQVRPL